MNFKNLLDVAVEPSALLNVCARNAHKPQENPPEPDLPPKETDMESNNSFRS